MSHWPLSLTLAILTWLFIISPLSLGKCKLTISCDTHMTFWLKVVTQAEMCSLLRRHLECLWRHSAHLSSKRQTGDSQCTTTLMVLCYTCTLPFSQEWVHRHIALLTHTQLWQSARRLSHRLFSSVHSPDSNTDIRSVTSPVSLPENSFVWENVSHIQSDCFIFCLLPLLTGPWWLSPSTLTSGFLPIEVVCLTSIVNHHHTFCFFPVQSAFSAGKQC